MEPTPLNFSGLHPSRICLGTADLGSTVSQKDSFALLDAYVDLGGNFFDTAKVYADWLPGERSSSEKLLGIWMRQRCNRQRIILATKGAHPDLATMNVPRLSRAEIEADLDASLHSLQTDVIDLYWLHRDDPQRPVEDILSTLNDAVTAGKIRHFGCSNWRLARIRQANETAQANRLLGFAANQPMWSMAEIDASAIGDPTTVVMDKALWDYHNQTQLPAIPYSATANGLFQKLARNGYDRLAPIHKGAYRSPLNRTRFEHASQLAARRNGTMTQVVLGFLLSQPFPTYPIVGPKTLDHLRDCLTALDSRLDEAEIAYIIAE
jgi:aryl-alcohol dehydrogenase-like predicted oxidoreductase